MADEKAMRLAEQAADSQAADEAYEELQRQRKRGHTRAPWWQQVDLILAVDSSTVAHLDSTALISGNIEDNARLIAGAPKLLEALKKIADPEWGPAEWQPLVRAMVREAKAAIAAAESTGNG